MTRNRRAGTPDETTSLTGTEWDCAFVPRVEIKPPLIRATLRRCDAQRDRTFVWKKQILGGWGNSVSGAKMAQRAENLPAARLRAGAR